VETQTVTAEVPNFSKSCRLAAISFCEMLNNVPPVARLEYRSMTERSNEKGA
jgi:hypothetical protein